MQIQAFDFDVTLSSAAAAFRDALYVDDANWVAPPRSFYLSQFGREFWFYRKPGNRHRHFVAMADGKIAGHVSAFVNSDLGDRDGTPVASLGFFECVEQYATAAILLGAAIEWLNEQNVRRIWAPVNFDIWHGYRFMTRGFDQKTFYGEPYNKAYYPAFFEQYGFAAKKTWDTLERHGRPALESMIARFEPRYRRLLGDQYRFESIKLNGAEDLEQLHSCLVRSYSVMLGATPFEFASFKWILGQYLTTFKEKFITVVFDPNGNLAAFGVAFPDYSAALNNRRDKAKHSDREPIFLENIRADRAILYMIGASPEEVRKRHGTGSAIYYHMMQQMLMAGYETIVIAIVADDSGARSLVGDEMDRAQRTYTLYELNL